MSTTLDHSFRVERKQPGISISAFYLVILAPLLFLCVRGSFSFQFEGANNAVAGVYGGMSNGSSDTLAHHLEFLGVYGLFSLLLLQYHRKLLSACRGNVLLMLLPCLASVSALWSQAPSRSAILGIVAVINTLFALYIEDRFSGREQAKLFLFVGVVAAVSSILTVAFIPSAGIDQKGITGDFGVAWQGIFPHKNVMAIIMNYFLVTAITFPFEGNARLKRLIASSLFLSLIVLSQSRTGWIVAGLCITFVTLIRVQRRTRGPERMLWLCMLLSITVGAAMFVYLDGQEVLPILGKSATMTNRTVVWAAGLQSALKRPVMGFGYSAFWLGFQGESANTALMANDPGLMNAENGILQLLLELGLVGIVVLLVVLARACVNAARCAYRGNPQYTDWYLSIIFLTVLALFNGNKFMFPNDIEWTLLVMAYAGLAREARRLREIRQHGN